MDQFWKRFAANDYDGWKLVWMILNALILLLGLSTNLVYAHYLKSLKRSKRENLLFMNLVLASILTSLVITGMNLVSIITDSWFFGQFGCQFYVAFGYTLGFSCMSTIMNIMIIEFFVLRNSLNSPKLGRKHIIGIPICSWALALVLAVPIALSQHLSHDILELICVFDIFAQDTTLLLIAVSVSVALAIVPLLANLKLAWSKAENEKSMQIQPASRESLTKFIDRSPTPSLSVPKRSTVTISSSSSLFSPRSYRKERRNLKRTLCVVFFCAGSWVPFLTLAAVARFGLKPELFVGPMSTSLTVLISQAGVIFCPIIYAATDRKFKSYLQSVVLNVESGGSDTSQRARAR